jgi:hypothetical protein
MQTIQLIGKLMLTCAASLALAHASDFAGAYARIDKVVMEPNAESPERVQVWGVFALADPANPNQFLAPARGYLYYKLDRNPQAARNEWNDLKQVAGSKEIVAFGMRGLRPRLRKSGEEAANPDPYGTNVGVQKVSGKTDYAPIRALLDYKD